MYIIVNIVKNNKLVLISGSGRGLGSAIAKSFVSKNYKVAIDIVDPWIEQSSISENKNIQIFKKINKSKKYKAVICAVAHKQFYDIKIDEWKSLVDENGILFDLKGLIPRELDPLRI